MSKEKYTPEEWRLLQETLSLSGLLVILASPLPSVRGSAGLLKETNALYMSLTRMLNHGAAYPLIDELRLDMRHLTALHQEGQPEGQPFRELNLEQVHDTILDYCRQSARLLREKADPEEAAYFKKGLLWVCAQIAQAANENGGFLGSSGQPITEEERQAIRQIAFALGLSASEPLVEELPSTPRRKLPTQIAGFINSEEWQILREAPVWVSSAALQASSSGVIGTLREVTTMVRSLRSARERFPENRLIDAVVDELGILASVGGETPFLPEEKFSHQVALQKAVEACQKVAQLLGDKALEGSQEHMHRLKEEGYEFKQMLLDIAREVAETNRDGGFLGFGGKRVNDEEQALLEAVTGALAL